MFKLGEYGDAFTKPTSSPSRADPNEQFKHNILKQRDLFKGDKPLTPSGKEVQPTFEVKGDTVEYGLKFGGAWVKLDGTNKHYKWPTATFAEYLTWLADQAGDGEFEIQLRTISDNIRARLTKKAVVHG